MPIAMPAADIQIVVSAPERIARTSAKLKGSELRREAHRQVPGLAEPLLLQRRHRSAGLLLGDELVQELEQVGIALGDSPRGIRLSRHRLAELEDTRLLAHQRLQVD